MPRKYDAMMIHDFNSGSWLAWLTHTSRDSFTSATWVRFDDESWLQQIHRQIIYDSERGHDNSVKRDVHISKRDPRIAKCHASMSWRQITTSTVLHTWMTHMWHAPNVHILYVHIIVSHVTCRWTTTSAVLRDSMIHMWHDVRISHIKYKCAMNYCTCASFVTHNLWIYKLCNVCYSVWCLICVWRDIIGCLCGRTRVRQGQVMWRMLHSAQEPRHTGLFLQKSPGVYRCTRTL